MLFSIGKFQVDEYYKGSFSLRNRWNPRESTNYVELDWTGQNKSFSIRGNAATNLPSPVIAISASNDAIHVSITMMAGLTTTTHDSNYTYYFYSTTLSYELWLIE